MTAPSRPALRYLGGKWRMAPWIISHFPAHTLYVEPYGGAASVLLRKPRSHGEIYNDLDGEVVNLFQVLRSPALSADLAWAVSLTPYARAEFDLAYQVTDEPVERARRLLVRSFMGFGSNAPNMAKNTGFRGNATRRHTTPAVDWTRYPPVIAELAARIQSGVQLECRPALDVIRQRDGVETLFYLDPPYVQDTRSQKMARGSLHNAYTHEMSIADHEQLLEAVLGLKGMVVLSGYGHPLYDDALSGWDRLERTVHTHAALKRTEVLWRNPAAIARQAAA